MADRQYPPLAEPFPPADTPLPQATLPELPLPLPRLRLEALAGPPVIALPYDLPLLDPSPVVMRARPQPQATASTEYGRADVVVTPDLVAQLDVVPLPRPRLTVEGGQPLTPILDTAPSPGDLTTTIVLGDLPCAIIPSGMTPGDDVDG